MCPRIRFFDEQAGLHVQIIEVTHVNDGHYSVQVVPQWMQFEEQAGPHLQLYLSMCRAPFRNSMDHM